LIFFLGNKKAPNTELGATHNRSGKLYKAI
jgi:hypothetical protein